MRRLHKHRKVQTEPLIEKPSKSATLRERLNSPWLVIGQYIFNVLIVLFIAYLAGNQSQFSDYLNGKGEERDRERDAAVQAANERAEQSREVLCRLIAALEADIGGELERIRREASCPVGPLPNTDEADPDGASFEPSEQPSASGPTSMSLPSTDPRTTTGDRGGVAPGRESSPAIGPAAPSEGDTPPASPSEEPPPPSENPDDGGGGSVSEEVDEAVDLCVIILGCVV